MDKNILVLGHKTMTKKRSRYSNEGASREEDGLWVLLQKQGQPMQVLVMFTYFLRFTFFM